MTSKIGVAFGITFVMAALIKVPVIFKIVKAYPLDSWGAKVRSMTFAGQSGFALYNLGICLFTYPFSNDFFVCNRAGGCGIVCTLLRDMILTNILGIAILLDR